MDTPRLALSIAEFAKASGLSRAFIYQEIKSNRGPALTRCGRRVLVIVEDGRAWLRSRRIESEAKKEAA